MNNSDRDPASFRDPHGFVYRSDGSIFRKIQPGFMPVYDSLRTSKLLDELWDADLLIPHREVLADQDDGKVIQPEVIPFISYPYEWSFSQLRDAALLTLAVMEQSMKRGFWLKDASAYNIQFRGRAPVLIDTLSLIPYREGHAWPAYHQFCKHFLAPLALMSYVDLRLSGLLLAHIDGIPLDLASRLLPMRSFASLGLTMHLHLHANFERRFASRTNNSTTPVSKEKTRRLVLHLKGTVERLKLPATGSNWTGYYQETNYQEEALAEKQRIVERVASRLKPALVLDLGANTGLFSRTVAPHSTTVISTDSDPATVEKNYRLCESVDNVLPLISDLSNPSPGIGWDNQERSTFSRRAAGADLVLALALIHHLAIAGNIPFDKVSEYFSSMGRTVVIEWVPKGDSQVERMLATRQDSFSWYTLANFERAFGERFTISEVIALPGSLRILYVLQNKNRNGSS